MEIVVSICMVLIVIMLYGIANTLDELLNSYRSYEQHRIEYMNKTDKFHDEMRSRYNG